MSAIESQAKPSFPTGILGGGHTQNIRHIYRGSTGASTTRREQIFHSHDTFQVSC